VGVKGRGVDVGVVKVSQYVLHQFRFIVEVVVDKLLEVQGCVHETEGEDVRLVGSVRCVERGQPFLSLFDVDLVVSGLHIEFREDPGPFYLVHDLIYAWEGVCVPDGDVVQFLIIDYWSFHSVLLPDEEDGCGCWAMV